MLCYLKYNGSIMKAPSFLSPFPVSPEVGLCELLHVELLVCEGGQVDITNGGKHFT